MYSLGPQVTVCDRGDNEISQKFSKYLEKAPIRPSQEYIKALYSVWLTKIEASLVGGLNKENEKYI